MDAVAGQHRHDGENDSRHGEHDSHLAELTRRMVALYKEQFGRGPTKAKTSYADANTLVSSFENSLTAAERRMVQLGERVRLEETRLFFQRAAHDDFVAIVEEVTGRRVRAFVSGMDAGADVASEVFYLEPLGADGTGRPAFHDLDDRSALHPRPSARRS